MADTDSLVITDPKLPANKLMLEGVSLTNDKGEIVPLFTVSEVAKFFFGRSPHWVRWLENNDKIVLDGEPVADQRTEKGARSYSLFDVERMAHALASNKAISAVQLRNALVMVKTSAKVYGYILEPNRLELFTNEKGEWHWKRFVNNRKVDYSKGEGFATKAEAEINAEAKALEKAQAKASRNGTEKKG